MIQHRPKPIALPTRLHRFTLLAIGGGTGPIYRSKVTKPEAAGDSIIFTTFTADPLVTALTEAHRKVSASAQLNCGYFV
jgi:hypothetical protein